MMGSSEWRIWPQDERVDLKYLSVVSLGLHSAVVQASNYATEP